MTSFRIWRGSNCRRKTLRSCHDADAADAMERGRVAASFPVATLSVVGGKARKWDSHVGYMYSLVV